MTNAQLELSLENAAAFQTRQRQPRWFGRAHWWFERMRAVVDRAVDWAPAPPPRPEQICLPNVYRVMRVPAPRPVDEPGHCE